MLHLILGLVCILTFELFLRFDLQNLLIAYFKTIRKIVHILFEKKISDHWKQMVIPSYALKLMKFSMKILLLFIWIIFFIFLIDLYQTNFLQFLFSLNGILESMIFLFVYSRFRGLLFE